MASTCEIPIPLGNSIILKIKAHIKGNTLRLPINSGEYYYLMFGATTRERILEIQKEGERLIEIYEKEKIKFDEDLKKLESDIFDAFKILAREKYGIDFPQNEAD